MPLYFGHIQPFNISKSLSENLCVKDSKDVESTQAGQVASQYLASLSLTGALRKKTINEVWRDIQQNKDNKEKKSQDTQPTFGEVTLEDFLMGKGIVFKSFFKKGAYY